MEIVNFSDKKFQDIPEQDNPAYGKCECLMLCQSGEDKKLIILLHIDPVENSKENKVNKIAMFWDEDIAWDIAGMYEKIAKPK